MKKQNTSSLSRSQWAELEKLADAFHTAKQALEVALLQAAKTAENKDDEVLRDRLLAETDRNPLPSYFYHCQPEWTGGDSQNPKNHVLREPHITGRRLTVA